MKRKDSDLTVSVALEQCATSVDRDFKVDIKLSRLPAGGYSVRLAVPNDFGLDPEKRVDWTVRPIKDDTDALMVAVGESLSDTLRLLDSVQYPSDQLERAFLRACTEGDGRDLEAISARLIAGGANPASVIHHSANAPRCLPALIGAMVDVNLVRSPKLHLEGTPLFFAVGVSNIDSVRILLAAGADPNKTFGFEQSAYVERPCCRLLSQ